MPDKVGEEEIHFAAGVDAAAMRPRLESLLEHGWSLDETKSGLRRAFWFRNYTKCLPFESGRKGVSVTGNKRADAVVWQDFVQLVGIQSKAANHHGTITIVCVFQFSWLEVMWLMAFQTYGCVTVHWTTHRPKGLTHKDVDMAEHCQRSAELLGCVEEKDAPRC
ncbi:hypothetical protein ANO11243_063960 [Dothideomycetidae sp. 11243]|nr:hypothetical protein ANO11243_063960 [fungal sp. No.11243]